MWIDTYADINGEDTRIVSEEPFAITCCLQSGKYRRFLKKTAQWVRKNVDKDYMESNALKNIQDLSFAMDMIAEARRKEALLWAWHSMESQYFLPWHFQHG